MASRTATGTESTKSAGQKLVTLCVNMNAETAAALKEIADERGLSYTEAVRRAISIAKFVEDEIEEGRKIQTVDADRKDVRELVLM